jgi:UDP:flavonoid glycosyltransferase YjiC (YdhE family)
VHPMLDHQMIGASVAQQGAGLLLPSNATPAEIAAAVARLLQDPRHQTAAADLGARLRSQPGQQRAADLVEELL